MGDARHLWGIFLPDWGAYHRAELERALAGQEGRDGASWALRGRWERLLGRGEAARACFETALRLDPACPEALAFRGEADLRSDPAAALEDLTRACELRPKNGFFRLWQGYALFLLAEPEAAARMLDMAVLLEPFSAAARFLRGVVSSRAGNFKGAAADFGAGARLAPSLPGFFILRAAVRWQAGDRDAAVEDAHRAMDLHPESLDGFVRLLLLKAGQAPPQDMAQQRRLLAAAADSVLKEDPRRAWAYAARAEVLGVRHSSLLARARARDLRKSVDLDGSRAWVRAFLARALATLSDEKGGRGLDKALAESDAAVARAPRSGWIRCWRAELRRKAGDGPGALADLDAGLKLQPDYRLALAWRASLRHDLGDAAGGERDMSLVLDTLPRAGFFHERGVMRAETGNWAQALEDWRACALGSAGHAFSCGGLARAAGAPRPDRAALEKLAEGGGAGRALALAWLGRKELEKGKWKAARKRLDAAAAADPACPLVRTWRAEVLLRAGSVREAAADLAAAADARPYSVLVRLWRSAALSAGARPQEGRAMFEAVAAQNPELQAALARWGRRRLKTQTRRRGEA
mgnify:FL=1